MRLTKNDLLVICCVVIIIGFLLGWLFPVEGPVDYVYDNYRTKKCAEKICPPTINVDELSEEELDFIREAMQVVIGDEER